MIATITPLKRSKSASAATTAGPIDPALREAVRRWMETEIQFIDHPEFARIKPGEISDEQLFGTRLSATEPPPTQLVDGELLRPADETMLFRAMNLLKFQARRVQQKLALNAPDRGLIERLEGLLHRAAEIRNTLIRANVRLVVSVAKKFATSRYTLPELVSDGNLTLFRAVEKFDFGRGFRFSTYATWALRYNFARAVGKPRDLTGFAPVEGETPLDIADHRADPAVNRAQLLQHRALERMLDKLDDRERAIITRRYGLEAGEDEQSLQEVAHEMGICKERVRQLQMRALEKLRVLARRRHLEEPARL
ncbi:MAG: hypothetical protein C0483_22485 [Pirellula sp.]|nr:hypothetical protein [Pirellula sp.]